MAIFSKLRKECFDEKIRTLVDLIRSFFKFSQTYRTGQFLPN